MRLLTLSLIFLTLSGCGINLTGTYQGFETINQNQVFNPGLGSVRPQLTMSILDQNGDNITGQWTRQDNSGFIGVGSFGSDSGTLQGTILNGDRIDFILTSQQQAVGGTGQCQYRGFAVLNNDTLTGQITQASGCALTNFSSTFILNRITN